jgi:hypothetical protein
MPANSYRRLRHRAFDRFRQKLWAVPAWFWLCVLRRGAGKPARRRNASIR